MSDKQAPDQTQTTSASDASSAVQAPPAAVRGILRFLGPGLILAGSIVGSGELIATTKTGAEAGFSLLWLILIGCVIKVFVQVELGRFTICTGKTTLVALNAVPGPRLHLHLGRRTAQANWIVWFWLLMFMASLGQLGGIVGGVGQALAISWPLTEEGRQYNDALDAQVKLQATTARLDLIHKRNDVALDKSARPRLRADLEMEIAALTATTAAFQKQVDAHREYQQKRAELAQLEEVVEAGDDSDFADELRRRIAALKQELPGLKQTVADLGAPPQPVDDKYWAVIIGAVTILLLVSGRYSFIEMFSMVLVGLFTLITIGNVFALQTHDEWAVSWSELAHGLSFHFPTLSAEQKLAGMSPLATALAAFGIIGVGASELVAYPYWCLEKGYARWTGRRDDTPAWADRARGWMRVMRWDAWCSMVFYTFATIAFYLLGAGVLARTGLDPAGTEMIRTLAVMYEPVFGHAAEALFLFGAFAVLYSTFFVANAAHTRLATDVISAFGIATLTDRARRNWIRVFGVIFPTVCVIIYVLLPAPVTLVLISGVMQALLLPMLGFAALFYRYKHIDPRLKPSLLWDVFLWISFFGFLVVGLYLTYVKVFT